MSHLSNFEVTGAIMVNRRPLKHSELQAAITRDFVANFAPKTNLLYLEDGAKQTLVFEKDIFASLGVPLVDFNGLPDTILFDEHDNLLFLIQAITLSSPKPISFDRRPALEELFGNSTARRVYVNAFLYFSTYKRFIKEISWKTKVWIAEAPAHMIHYD
jgi:adenine-specific DNA-methyltransferase